ncbi:transposase family protein [Microbispora sp. NBC_01189]|uniref:transposase family protein n=1 Tax=Microbispora sp. NBC_01189 TaxID=2903583 RepID=UPI002E0F5581|nr:transposase family protein [Microbispora sp. NBC_01189]
MRRAHALIILISCRLDQLADLATGEAELATDPAATEPALVGRLSKVPGRRSHRGRRHPLVVILALIACATLVVGGDSTTAIWQWAAGTFQEHLRRLGAYPDPFTGRFVIPSERTFRRVLADLDADALDADALDADALDTAVSGYVTDVVGGSAPRRGPPCNRPPDHLGASRPRRPDPQGATNRFSLARPRSSGSARTCDANKSLCRGVHGEVM